uniref:NADH-ubiquinone oxidoreductase chain 4L n=1 Tax=Rhynchocinetes durbanensis TaxID=516932 RepID=A0A0X9SJ89_9EUCA|nr:NADH dehydrogenase subunit 4L [Rhynchocinetes durbanensis]AMA20515.1 NADH dehydrogenase subunit 4L [Rhynchocinetes durbanensis]
MPFLDIYYSIHLFCFVCGLYSFMSLRKHLLSTLISLEFVMLMTYWMLVSLLSGVGLDVYFVLYFISLVACEGALGLSLLVSVVRSQGNEMMSSFNFLQC